MSDDWQDIKTAPKGRPIEVRMPLVGFYEGQRRDWVATAVLHEDDGHWADGAAILHYNSATLRPGFRGPLTHWRELPHGSDESSLTGAPK